MPRQANKISSSGVMKLLDRSRKGERYFNSSKFAIIGPSGVGKTLLAINLAVHCVKPYTNIVYVAPMDSACDKYVSVFREWCAVSKILFFHVDVSNGGLNLPDIKNSLYIIDDCYTSTGRNPAIEHLVKILFNRGRHSKNHVIYNAQCYNRLQPEIKQNSNGIFITTADAAEYFGASVQVQDIIRICEGTRTWFRIMPSHDVNFVEKVEFPEDTTLSNIYRLLRDKIPSGLKENWAKEYAKFAGVRQYSMIKSQGNIEAEPKKAPKPSPASVVSDAPKKCSGGLFGTRIIF